MGKTNKTSIETKKLKGTLKDSTLKKLIELPRLRVIEKPNELINEYAERAWVEVTTYLNNSNRLCEGYYNALLMYCNEVGIYWEMCAILKKEGMVYKSKDSGYAQSRAEVSIKASALVNAQKLGASFGLDPLSHSKLPFDNNKKIIDPFAEL